MTSGFHVHADLIRYMGLFKLKMCLQTYADNEGPDQPAQSSQGLCCPLTESLDTMTCLDDTLSMRGIESMHFAHARKHILA